MNWIKFIVIGLVGWLIIIAGFLSLGCLITGFLELRIFKKIKMGWRKLWRSDMIEFKFTKIQLLLGLLVFTIWLIVTLMNEHTRTETFEQVNTLGKDIYQLRQDYEQLHKDFDNRPIHFTIKDKIKEIK